MKVIQWQPSQLWWTSGACIDHLYTNFLFDCLLLHGHTLCNIIKQGKLVISWCVCVSACFFFFCLVRPVLEKKKNSSKLRWQLFQSETTLTSSLQSADLTATIVWARWSYRYLTAAHGMMHIDDRLPFVVNLQLLVVHSTVLHYCS